MNKTLWEEAFETGCKVEEKKSGIQAEVINFVDELYLYEGTSGGISPVTAYDEEDFKIVYNAVK